MIVKFTLRARGAALLTGVDWHLAGLGNMYELIAQNQEGKPGYEMNDLVSLDAFEDD